MELPYGLTPDALAAAEAEPDPGLLGAGTRLRARFGPDLAAAALTQVTLRRKARTKFGDAAAGLFFTRDGLEQATRQDHAAYLGDWLRILRADPRAIVAACGHAQRAVDLLNKLASWTPTTDNAAGDDDEALSA